MSTDQASGLRPGPGAPATAERPDPATAEVVRTVEALAADVFDRVARLRATVEQILAAAPVVRQRDLAPLEAPTRGVLEQVDGAVAGAGFVARPGLLDDLGWWLEWWTVGDDHHRAVRLLVETDADADGFRDYTVLPWYDVPLRTGRPHVAGPYVDYLCSDEYMLTFTVPVLRDGGFAGVVGADVPVRHVERMLVPALRRVAAPAALVNAEGRVVAGNRPTLVTGHLLRGLDPAALAPCAGTPLAVALPG